ncbi:MAG: hypothetical protein CVU38_20745 [Chloroflexi bacterium HGW-Chloroflexi-1]|nr:MAG: hypothetical protein CVU38_20745 [Chloroflexi bacterium HGW-Chloroflexi-1]
MVVIDSDVLLLEFAYHRDPRQDENALFLQTVRHLAPGITIYTLMEVLGQLSFNLSADEFIRRPAWLEANYGLGVLWPKPGELEAEDFFRREIQEQPFARMQAHRMAFGDALVLTLAENTPNIEAFVTWNARHFKGKTLLPVLTPVEYLAGSSSQST